MKLQKKQTLFWMALALFIGAGAPALVWADPCFPDVEKLCGDVQPGMGAVAACLEQNRDNLSTACRERLSRLDKTMVRKAQACSSDAREFCRDVKPGYNRIKDCLYNKIDWVTPGCRDFLQN